MSRPHDSKQAEKTYLSRTGGSAWEREKPFPPRGTELFDESLELLSDFVVAMKLLQPSPDDLIVDLGAGGGWCSDLLQRLNRKAVAVDISLEMLQVGRRRPTPRPIRCVAGDFEHLPFATATFDKAVCLSALHHVPDMAAAVAEIARVLNDKGVAVFSEPGVGHAEKPWSVSASQDFGVLEQDVRIDSLMAMCRQAGFAQVHVCPMSYVIPEFELSDEDWRAWRQLPRTPRPIRALGKMWRAMLEFVGAAKKDLLFEEAFAMRLVRLLQVPVEEHPFVLAAKTDERRRVRPRYGASIAVDEMPAQAAPGASIAATLTLTNTGTIRWPAGETATGQVRIGIQLLSSDSRVVEKDFARSALPADLAPGASIQTVASFNAPVRAGEYKVKFDLVAEGVTWFEPAGTKPDVRDLRVFSG